MGAAQPDNSIATLLALVQHRWNIPIIAGLSRRSGAKFVTLASELAISRSMLSASLRYLRNRELVMRNPGYGHPMRPEYLLTGRGAKLGKHCEALMQWLRRRDAADLALRKWSLPTVALLGQHGLRFNELRQALGKPSPRAVTLCLQALRDQDWVRLDADRRGASQAAYRLAHRARSVLPILSLIR